MRRFVLLDRDGTINVERHYLSRPEDVELLPQALAGLQRLQALGLGLAILTNQSGIARGYFDRATLDAVHERLKELLAVGGVVVDGIFFCPHVDANGCSCRKPLPGLVQQAVRELQFDPTQAFVIGDKAIDVALGRAVGGTTLLVTTGYGAETLAAGTIQPDYVVADLLEAAERIERLI